MATLVIFRENDFFFRRISVVVDALKSLGQDVVVHYFDRNDGRKEIYSWLVDNVLLGQWDKIVADETVATICRSTKIRQVEVNLDYLFERATWNVIEKHFNMWKGEEDKGESEDRYTFSLRLTEARLSRVISEIDSRKYPAKVYIMLPHILDHEPFYYDPEIYGKEDELSQDLLDNKKVEAASKLKEWFVAGGIQENSIILAEKLSKEEDKEKDWVVVDRHYDYPVKETYDHPVQKAVALHLPFYNFYADAKMQGLLEIAEVEIRKAIQDLLEEEFKVD